MSQANAGEIRARLTLDATQFRRQMQSARQSMNDTSDSTRRQKAELKQLETMYAGLGAAVLAVAGSSVYVAAQYEQSMARVRAITQATDSEFALLNERAQELGATTEFSASQAADGMGYLAMAGFEVKEIYEAMPSVLNLASAAQMGLAESSDIVSNIMTGFKLTAQDTGKAVDVLVETMTNSNTNLAQLGDAMKYVAPIASSLGLSIEETAAAIGFMSDAGIQGSQAGTSLRMALIRLASPPKEAADAMEDLGVKITDAKGEFKSMPDIVKEFERGLNGLSDAQKIAALSTIVGVEAASGFLTIIERGSDELSGYTKQLENSQGAAEKFAKIQRETLQGAIKELMSTLEGLGIQLGNELLPEITEFVKHITDIVRKISEWNAGSIETAVKIAAMTTAVGLAITSIKRLAIAIKGLQASAGLIGVVSLALGTLLTGLMDINSETEKSKEVNLEHANSLREQSKSLEDTIARYDSLREKNKLTNEEIARFVDLQKLLKMETDPEKIASMQKEYDSLSKKSGLTNEEMTEFLGLNDKIVSEVPNANTILSEQGRVILKNTDAAKAYNEQIQKEIELELRKQANNASEGLEESIRKRTEALKKQNELAEEYIAKQKEIIEQQMRVAVEEAKVSAAKQNGTEAEITLAEKALEKEKGKLRVLEDQGYELNGQIIKQEEKINKIETEVVKGQEAYQSLIKYRLEQVNVNAEKGKEVEALDKAIKKTEALRKKKREQFQVDGSITEEEQKQLDKLDDKITKMKNTKTEVGRLKEEQDKLTGAIDKSVGVAEDLTYEMDKDVEKWIKQKGFNKKDAKEITDEAGKNVTKHVKQTGASLSDAKKQSDEYGKDVTKNVVVKAIKSGATAAWNWITGKSHSGRAHHRSLPKRHNGGDVREEASQLLSSTPSLRAVDRPRSDEVDVRLLRNEMVLTATQQENLFRMVKSFNAYQEQQIKRMAKKDGESSITNIFNINGTVREEADIHRIMREIKREQERDRYFK